MKRRGLTDLLAQVLPDKRRDNSHIPFDILLCLAVAAKLKCKTSLTDVPFAISKIQNDTGGTFISKYTKTWTKKKDIQGDPYRS